MQIARTALSIGIFLLLVGIVQIGGALSHPQAPEKGLAAQRAKGGEGAAAEATRPPSYARRQWTVEDGLPVNSIQGIVQGPQGYLWITTNDGLARFDGVEFSVYRTDEYDGLPSNRLRAVVSGPDSTLWMKTGGAELVRFRIDEGAFAAESLPNALSSRHVVEITKGASGALWVSTKSGTVGLQADSVWTVLGAAEALHVQKTIEARDGTVWLATKSGVWRSQGTWPPSGKESLGPLQRVAPTKIKHALDVYQGPSGKIWVSGHRGVFAIQDGVARRLSPARCRPDAECVLAAGSPHVLVLEGDSTGAMWMRDGNGSYYVYRNQRLTTISRSGWSIGASILLYGPRGMRWRAVNRHLYREGRRVFSAGTLINTLTFDRQGNIWIGTYRNGLYRLRPSPATTYGDSEGLPSNNVYAVHEPPSDPGEVWVGMLGGGLARIDVPTGTVDASPLPAASKLSVVWTLWEDEDDRLWIGGEGLRYVESGHLRTQGLPDTLHEPPPDLPPQGGPSKRVRVFYEDNSDRLWVGSKSGLFRRADDSTWTRFGPAKGGPEALVRVIEQVDNGALWMGTKGEGLVRYRNGTFQSITTADGLSGNLIRAIHEGADGFLWVGTEGKGLCRIDRRGTSTLEDDRINCLDEEEGLFDDVIHAILPDGRGCLWMSTNRGIFWVERSQLISATAGRREAVESHGYTEADGLRAREANGGGQPAAVRTSDGRLWFSTQSGVVVFDPSRLQRSLPPPVTIERLAVDDSTYRTPGAAEASIHLAPDQRTFDIEYTGLNLREPRSVTFRYRLRGFDSWQTVEGQHRAHYTNVPPGTYTFEVKAANENGNWSRTSARLTVTIAPHWWETTWFYLLCGLGLLGIGVGAYRWRVHRLEKREEALEEAVTERTEKIRHQRDQIEAQAEKLKELDAAKSRFFANVSHEFRTPLTLILGAMRDLRAYTSEQGAEQLDLIEQNTQRLRNLVEQLLGIARMDAGTYQLNARPTDLGSKVQCIAWEFEALCEQKGLTLTVNTSSSAQSADETASETAPVYVDPEALEHIVGNLLSNAAKFTSEGGKVEVSVIRAPDYAEIMVADTGRGIPQEKQTKIFDRFAQLSEKGSAEGQDGVGIGLAFVQELVDLHGGTVSIESAPGEGTTFTIRLPRGRDHLAEKHLAPKADGPESPEDAEQDPGDVSSAPPAFAPATGSSSSPPSEGPINLDGRPEQPTVLVVDDNPNIRQYVRSILTPDCCVVEAADGEEGCVRAQELQPDCILVDVMMPEIGGREIVRQLRANRSTDCIPIIMLTARAGVEEEAEGLSAGADDYVTKPFDPEVLRARVFGQIATRQRLRRRIRAELRDEHDDTEELFRDTASGKPTISTADPPELAPPVLEPPRLEAPIESEEEPTFVREARRAVETHLADPDLTVEEFADELAVSRSTLYRRLKEEAGQTPSQFIRQIRVEYGAQLLREEAGTVSEIAYAVGFSSLTYFGESFRKHVGVPPSQYAEEEA